MDAQMKKGVLELCLLQRLSQGERYGCDLSQELRQFFPEVGESAFYAILRRLRQGGAVEDFPGAVSGGPPRKYYRITDVGLQRLRRQMDAWLRLREIMDALLEGGPG